MALWVINQVLKGAALLSISNGEVIFHVTTFNIFEGLNIIYIVKCSKIYIYVFSSFIMPIISSRKAIYHPVSSTLL
jgi:hypothetical protein